MIFTESTITISNNNAKINSPIVLYRGDKNVEIRFTILQSPFKYSNTVATNIIESTNASYGQLVIKTPNDKPPIFSEVSATKEGTILFTITKEMIDEIEEVGAYTFQIRLMDENKQSRATIPPVENGIEIKEPIAIEDDNSTNVVGLAKANYAVATSSDVDTPTFDDNGKYIKTNWNDGDIITNASLNKIEDGIYTTNENVTATKKYVDDDINYNNKQFNNKISAIHMSRHPVSCSTEIYKKPLCDIFPELLNITYNTVFKEFNSFKVNMDNFAKEYPTVKSAYNKLNINLYDENDNSIGNSYGNSINGEGLNIIFINITESLRFYAYFDKALVDGSDTTMETKNGYMTIQLLIPKGNNKQEFIDKIKNLKLTLSVFRVDFLNLNNETIYTPTTDYHPATKKYVDDNTPIKSLPVNPTTKTGAVVDVNNITVSGCYALPKRSDGAHWTNLMMRAMINDGSGKGKSIMLSGYQNYVFHVNVESKKIYCDNLRIVYNIGTTADTTDIRTEPYFLPTTNTKEYTPTNDYNPATKKYVDDNILLEQLPILRVDETNKRIYVNCNNMGTYKKYFVPNKYANAYGFSFIYTNEDKSETEIALIGGAMTRDDFILCARNTNTLFILILGGTDKYTYTKSTKTLEKGLYGYLKIGNTQEYTPTNDYNPATKKYVDDIKTGIDGIKADLGTAQLTTTAKDVKGAVNEVNAQCKDIAKNFNGELEHKANIDSFNSNITYITNVYKSADNDLLSKIKYLTDYINNNLLASYTFITNDLLNVNTTSSIDDEGQLIVSKSGTNAFTWTTFNKSQENNEFEFTINSNDCYFVLCANATKCIAIQLGVHVDDFGLITRWYANGLVENLNEKETDQTRKAIIGDVIKVSRIPSGWKMTKNNKEWLTVPFIYNDANLQTEFTESEKQYGVMKYNATENESVIKHCNIKKIIILPNSSQFNNKTWNAIGDSITWLNKYEPIVANALGISTVRNYGKSGFSTVMLKGEVSSWDNDADLISFFAGTNDFGRCDDLSTTENSVDYIFSNLKTKYPNKKIVVCLPIQRWGYTGDTVNGSQPTMTNSKGIKLWQYCEIIMKKANQYDLPVLDLYNLSGITKDNINIYTADGLHPNDDGFKKISAVMIDFFNSI